MFHGQQPTIKRFLVSYENRTTEARRGLPYKSDGDARHLAFGGNCGFCFHLGCLGWNVTILPIQVSLETAHQKNVQKMH